MNRYLFLFINIFFLLSLLSCFSNNFKNFSKYEKETIIQIENKIKNNTFFEEKIYYIYELLQLNNNNNDYFIEILKNILFNDNDINFKNYLYFIISDLYWAIDQKNISIFYMTKISENIYDILYNNQPIGYIISLRIVGSDLPSKIKEKFYLLLLDKYKDMIDISYTYYELSQLYKNEYNIEKAIFYMELIVDYYNKTKNIYENINLKSLIKEIEFYKINKDWIYQDIELLIKNIKTAILQQDLKKLYKYISKINFECKLFQKNQQQSLSFYEIYIYRYWNQNIQFSDKVENISNDNEIYLKTKNWSFPLFNTWYFYFKRINYPYDYNINGAWEWAGIYFGDY